MTAVQCRDLDLVRAPDRSSDHHNAAMAFIRLSLDSSIVVIRDQWIISTTVLDLSSKTTINHNVM